MLAHPLRREFALSLAVVSGILFGVVGCQPEKSESRSDREVKKAGETAVADTKVTRESSFDRETEIYRSEQLLRGGQAEEAAAVLRRVLLADPTDMETLFRLATAEAFAGKLEEAVELLDSIPPDHPQSGLPALGQSAQWCVELGRYRQAERQYRTILERLPDAAPALRQLAFLLNRQGRRHEAAELIRRLCMIGDVRQDELHALMVLSDAVYDDPAQVSEVSNERAERFYFPIGASGEARKLFTDHQYAEAAELLADAVAEDEVSPAVMAFYGRTLAEAQDDEAFAKWLAAVDDRVKGFAEYWAALGADLVNHQRFDEAVHALGQALVGDPTDVRSYRRMNQALVAVGRKDDAQRIFDRHVIHRNVTLASNRIGEQDPPNPEDFSELTEGLDKLNRPLESVLWRLVEAFHYKMPKSSFDDLVAKRVSLVSSHRAFASEQQRVCGIDYKSFPAPKMEARVLRDQSTTARPRSVQTVETPVFENIAEQLGINHAYLVASETVDFGFAIYQTVGGGVAVIDYDHNGQPDLYFAQGGANPPNLVGELTNQLFRSMGDRYVDVTEAANVSDMRYSTGVTAGDWNQDGFADLVVANLGQNRLLINNGDGTFRSEATDPDNEPTMMTTSIAIADLSGDSLPDIYEMNYVDDSTLFKKPEVNQRGGVSVVSPLEFSPAMDRIFINDGRGGRLVTEISESNEDVGTGLGIVIADIDHEIGNEVFVGNDLRPNQLWKRRGDGNWVDLAPITGCALGQGGVTTASMGIAACDFDVSGTLDFHITNYANEPVSLFFNTGSSFRDRCIPYKLFQDSNSVVGFGCQGIDYNHDGRIDLVVTNGHVEDTKEPGHQFRQPPQLFANYGDHFRLMKVEDHSHYFGSLHLGRGLARLDCDQDGRTDFVVTHINGPSALLVNRTETDNHWLDVQLVGVTCERDAIGARIEVSADEQTWSSWVTAGDGFLCRNEAVASFGLGEITEVDSIRVIWPLGDQTVYETVSVDQRILLIQSEQEPFSLRSESSLTD